MISIKSRKWVEAGKILSKDPYAQVKCPTCEQDILVVQDVRNERNLDEFERIIQCPICIAYNALRMKDVDVAGGRGSAENNV